MKRFRIYPIIIALLGVLITSCHEKLPEIVPDPSENDTFQGIAKNLILGSETGDLSERNIRCHFLAENGEKIIRTGEHLRRDDSSHITLKIGLRDGIYRLLYLEYDLPEPLYEGRITTGKIGMGGRIKVTGEKMISLDKFDTFMQMFGEGTKKQPYIVSEAKHLQRINDVVNGTLTNSMITSETYFKQTYHIDIWELCWNFDDGFGWYPIGYTNILPFRGHYSGGGYTISGLYSYRDKSSGIGLFGFLHRAQIDSVVLEKANIYGLYATGGIAGAIVNSGGNRDMSTINGCHIKGSRIAGSMDSGNDPDIWSMSIGGILGAADQHSAVVITNCSTDDGTLITGANAVGGIIGSANLQSSTLISSCTNNAQVKGAFSAVGGIVGCADTLSITGCKNTANIAGALKYSPSDNINGGMSAGGIVGGAGVAAITACTNSGTITGHDGVGGIIGSTRLGNENEILYNTAFFRFCGNAGYVSGNSFVGGICGESQFGGYGLYNTGDVSGGDFTGGIVGNGSVAAVYNAVNSGAINGANYVSGIAGRAVWGSFVLNQNYGPVTAESDYAAGIVSLVGDNTFVHYCENGAEIISKGDYPKIGGIVGEIGDPSEWTASQTVGIIVGMLEIITPCFNIPAVAVVSEIYKNNSVKLFISSAALGLMWVPVDATLNAMGYVNIFTEDKAAAINQTTDSIVKQTYCKITKKIKCVRDSSKTWEVYTKNIEDLRLACEATSGNNIDVLCENLNAMRFERAEDIAADRRQKEIAHTAVASACIGIGSIAAIIGAIPTGGSSLTPVIAAAATAVGAVTTVAGGVNSVVQSITTYGDNTVLVTQCVNRGIIRTTNATHAYVGGIVGQMHDASLVRDCLNTGDHKGNYASHGQLTGCAGGGCELYNSFAIGATDSWNGFVGSSVNTFSIDMSGLYYYQNTSIASTMYYSQGKMLDDAECGNIDSYAEWSIGGDDSKWIMQTSTSPNYPVPYKSEAM